MSVIFQPAVSWQEASFPLSTKTDIDPDATTSSMRDELDKLQKHIDSSCWLQRNCEPTVGDMDCRMCASRVSNTARHALILRNQYSLFADSLAMKGHIRIRRRRGKALVFRALRFRVFRFRCPPRHHGTTNTDRLSAVISDRGRILGHHTTWFRIVRSLNQSSRILSLPRAIETSAIQAAFNGSSAGDSLCPVPAQPSCTPTQSSLPNQYPKISWLTDESERPLLFDLSPKQGSTTGGDEIYLIVKNLPSNVVLYARFGDNIAPTCHIADGVLYCHLPAAARSGVVNVTLCQASSVHEDCYGKSLVSFEYEVNTSKAAALLPKLFDGAFPTEAMLLMLGPPNHGTQEPTTQPHSDPIHSESVSSSALPESAFLEILSTLKSLPDFQQRLSRVNEYRQSLLHMAIHLRYRELVHRLVDWGVDLNIKDVNGFTPLHAAYLCGDASITSMLISRSFTGKPH